jgi:hypothetical protein
MSTRSGTAASAASSPGFREEHDQHAADRRTGSDTVANLISAINAAHTGKAFERVLMAVQRDQRGALLMYSSAMPRAAASARS